MGSRLRNLLDVERWILTVMSFIDGVTLIKYE